MRVATLPDAKLTAAAKLLEWSNTIGTERHKNRTSIKPKLIDRPTGA